MQNVNNLSLGHQVAKKISAWVLALVASIVLGLFLVSAFFFNQLLNQQVKIWDSIIPQYVLTNLIDSDYFNIQKGVELIRSTGLFSTFIITDNQKRRIAYFGDEKNLNAELKPITDEAKVIWGYYAYLPNFYKFIFLFIIAAIGFLLIVFVFYFLIRWRMRANLEDEFSRFNSFLYEIESVTEKLNDISQNENDEKLVFNFLSYNSEQLIINKAINRLLYEIKKANESAREAIAASEQQRFQDELTKTALQVSHDLGSPVSALEAIIHASAASLEELDRIAMRNALNRIRDIVYSLLKKTKSIFHQALDESLSQHLLSSLINYVVCEKRTQSSPGIDINFEINETNYGVFSLVRASDFCRMISNIINNAVEAISERGIVEISLTKDAEYAAIQIRDTGKGIPANVVKRLGRLGISFDKPHGTGMGLYHAKKVIGDWGGTLDILSEERSGTCVFIKLPITHIPSWFAPTIEIVPGHLIVIVDDDQSIHDVWNMRFAALVCFPKIDLLHFSSPEELIEWKNMMKIDRPTMFLCDYEFIGSNVTGIDLINQLNINFLSILVTSQVNSAEISHACENYRIKLLQKNVASFIPIKIVKTSTH